jgi:hypothetical protein
VDKELDILHDHYKDSFAYIREREKQRDRLFLYLVGVLGLLFLEVQYPATLQQLLAEVSAEGAKMNVGTLPIPIIASATWTVLMILVLRHSQSAISIERQYKYLHRLEDAVSKMLGDGSVYCREGKEYGENYPAFSWWSWFFYSYVSGIVTVGLAAYLAGSELRGRQPVSYNAYFDAGMALGVAVSLILYRGPNVAWGCRSLLGLGENPSKQ